MLEVLRSVENLRSVDAVATATGLWMVILALINKVET
jgi:hypothetical protein